MEVAIDGPAGAGKTTVATILKSKLNLIKIDTGAMYRCVALKTLEDHISLDEEEKIINLTKSLKIEFKNDEVYLNGNNVTDKIRSKEVTNIVSPLSSIVEVRKILVAMQRNMAKGKNVIMEGRDITTVVLPNATFKFYLDAKESIRAKRRYDELKEKNQNITYEEVLENIKNRDYNDKHKKEGSLKIADDAIYIDSSNMSLDEVIEKMMNIIGSEKHES